MKALFLVLVMVMQMASADVSDKTLIYCDYNSEEAPIYMDLYFSYDEQKDAYTAPELGVVMDENSVYPDYLWNLTATFSGSEVAFSAEKDGNSLSFLLPTNSDTITPGVVLNKSNGFISDFNLAVTGTFNGAAIAADFICYDPAAEAPQASAVR